MNGGSRIIAIGTPEDGNTERLDGQAAQPAQSEIATDEAAEGSTWHDAEGEATAPDRHWTDWLPATLALVASLAWTGFYVWANAAAFSFATMPSAWASIITGWTLPILLICAIWLIAMRNGTREAARSAQAARLLSSETAQLEAQLLHVNRELSLAREFLSAESRDLESFGRMATERLGQSAGRLQDLVRENSDRVETIGKVSETALDNMEKLRGQLPVISSSAKDVTNNIGNAGRTAQSQLGEMITGFNRINDFGQASEAQILSLRDIVNETLSGFSHQCNQLEQFAARRFAELEEQGNEFNTRLNKQEVDAIAGLRDRAAVLGEELDQARTSLNESEEAGLQSLHGRFSALNEEISAIASSLREDEAQTLSTWRDNLAAMEDDRSALFARLEQADTQAAAQAKQRLDTISTEADLIEQGLSERADRMIAELAERRESAELAEREAIARFSEMLETLDKEISERSQAHSRDTNALAERVSTILGNIDSSETDITRIAAQASQSGERITASLTGISDRLAEAQVSLSNTDSRFESLTDSSVRLLELVRASADHTKTELPIALRQSDEALSATEGRARDIAASLLEAGKNGQWLANQIDGSGTALKGILADITKMQFQLRDQAISHQESLTSLRQSFKAIEQEGDEMSKKALSDLEGAIATLEASAQDTVALISEQGAAGVARIAAEIRETSAEEIGNAIRNGAANVSGQLEQAASHAAGVSREATIQLRDQLGKVNELVANLESRVTHARERAEEQVNSDFARRAALITEALNSNAIDIAKALSTEVSDTAWDGYLRGDRGIFTRRAFSLVDNSDAKSIQQIYDRDSEFRDHVSRYIHDFEAMLRQVLSTRDGTALGVTLLSSDMGKLYVSLAQALERLRN